MSEVGEPLGLRNNNPGNIKATERFNVWQGQTGQVDGFCVFNTMDNGTRAIARILLRYIEHEKRLSVQQIISRWSATDVEAYIANVCRHVGSSPNDPVVWQLPALRNLIAGIIEQENGAAGWDDYVTNYDGYSAIERAIAAAGWKFDDTGSPVPWWIG